MDHDKTSAMMKPIETVKELVSAFGGRSDFAKFLKVVPTAVSNMVADRHIPRGYHLEIYLECKRRGIPLDLHSLFGIAAAEGCNRSVNGANARL